MNRQELMELEEGLAHFGVKGMKWGQRKVTYSDGAQASAKDIKSARKNVASQDKAVRKQSRKALVKRGEERAIEKAKLKEMKAEALMNPDRVTALRMTRGETILQAALVPLSPGRAIANVAARELTIRAVKKAQADASK